MDYRKAAIRPADCLRAGWQLFELPYLNSSDTRMVPNTFEAIAVGNASTTGLAYVAATLVGCAACAFLGLKTGAFLIAN